MQSLRAPVLLVAALGCSPNIVEAPDQDEVGESADSSTDASASASESGTGDSSTTNDTSSTEPADADWGTDTDPTTSSTDTGSTTDPTTETTTDPTTDSTTEGPSDCTSNADCVIGNCLEGACVQVESCKQLAELDAGDTLDDGVYQIDPDAEGPNAPFDVFCNMTRDGGGWTLVLKSDGNETTFDYDSAQWGSTTPYQPEFPDLDYNEAKLASYSTVAFDEILVGLEVPIGDMDLPVLQWLVLPLPGSSLHALIQPSTYVASAVGRDAWKGLVPGSSLQVNCNQEGLNVRPSDMAQHHRVRIGIVANEQDNCGSPNSRIGIGGGGDVCMTLPNATGNFAGCMADNGDLNLIGFGAVLVR